MFKALKNNKIIAVSDNRYFPCLVCDEVQEDNRYNKADYVHITGEIVLKTDPKAPEPTYQELRRAAYPEISEQLDMIYWDKVNGTNLWQEKISEIKAKYPKD